MLVENIAQVPVLELGLKECSALWDEFKRSREFVKIFGQAPVLEPGLAEDSVLRVEFTRSREFIEIFA